jgi:predicted esterase
MHVSAGGIGGKKALLLVLHGAGGSARSGLSVFEGSWDTPGLVLVAPAAKGSTWSVVTGRDIDRPAVMHALGQALERCPIDSRRMGVAGFSDGASYALSLGLANGQLFRAVIALSPGGIAGERSVGRPRVFIAHGANDSVLPISETSDVIVPRLRKEGYRVTYVRFRGEHELPDAISREVVGWFLRG